MRWYLNQFGWQAAAIGVMAAAIGLPRLAAQDAQFQVLNGTVAGQADDDEDDDEDEDEDDDDDDDDEESAKAPKHWLGISLKPIEGDLAAYLGSSHGVLTDSVAPDSPASKAGIEPGDILLSVNGEKLENPQALLKHMSSLKADKDQKLPVQKFELLRKGKPLTVELTPTERPKSKMESRVIVLTDDTEGEIGGGKLQEEWLRKLRTPDGINVFRFGAPLVWHSDGQHGGNVHRHVQSSEAGLTEINVNREKGKPAKITVKRNGETKEYSEENVDSMPEDIREMVKGMLSKDGQVKVEVKVGQSSDGSNKGGVPLKWRSLRGAGPEGLKMNFGELVDKEMIERYQKMAKEMADRSSKWAQDAAAMPNDIQDLKGEVESLRKELKALREQLDSLKK